MHFGGEIFQNSEDYKVHRRHKFSQTSLIFYSELNKLEKSPWKTGGTGQPISKPEPAILCGGLLRLWETPATFARKSVHSDPVLRSTFINRHYCRQTWIMPLFKLITTLILQRTLVMVLNCCKILVVIYFNLFNTVNHGLLCYFKYYRQRLIMTLYGNAALLLFYTLLLAY
jgi:hypothetical protein